MFLGRQTESLLWAAMPRPPARPMCTINLSIYLYYKLEGGYDFFGVFEQGRGDGVRKIVIFYLHKKARPDDNVV